MADRWMYGIARSIAQGKPDGIGNIIHDIRAGLDEQMAPETQPAGTVVGGDRDEGGGAAGGDVTPESGSGEPSSETETLAE